MPDNHKVVSRSHKAALAVLEELDLQHVVKNVDEDIRGMVVHKLAAIIESATTVTDLHLESRLATTMFNAAMQQLPDTVHDAIDPHADAVVSAMDTAVRRYLGDGPISVGVAHRINQIHSEGYAWQVGYNPEHKEYCVLHFNDTTPERADSPGAGYSTDSLFEAIRTAQKSMKEAEND